jgi:hypothetical protein
MIVPLEIAPGDNISVDYGSLGQVAMQFAPIGRNEPDL